MCSYLYRIFCTNIYCSNFANIFDNSIQCLAAVATSIIMAIGSAFISL